MAVLARHHTNGSKPHSIWECEAGEGPLLPVAEDPSFLESWCRLIVRPLVAAPVPFQHGLSRAMIPVSLLSPGESRMCQAKQMCRKKTCSLLKALDVVPVNKPQRGGRIQVWTHGLEVLRYGSSQASQHGCESSQPTYCRPASSLRSRPIERKQCRNAREAQLNDSSTCSSSYSARRNSYSVTDSGSD